jgi:hypothetical protein
MFWIFGLLHLIALVLFWPALFVTIPLHIFFSSQDEKSDEMSKLVKKIVARENSSKDRVNEVLCEEIIQEDDTDDKWKTAKKYLPEVKDGLHYINNRIKPSARSKNEADNALKDVFQSFGVSSINPTVLDNIVSQVKISESNRALVAEEALKKLREEKAADELILLQKKEKEARAAIIK